ncbi:MAG: PAS domain S-box protein [Chitinophagaceae bacterium]
MINTTENIKLDEESGSFVSEFTTISNLKKQYKKIKILHLEDVSSDAVLVNNKLKTSKLHYEIVVVNTKDRFIKELKDFSPDIILADNLLHSFNSQEALTILSETGFIIPFILVTASLSDELAADLIRKGADDYILKDRLNRLPVAIRNSLEKYRLKRANKGIIDEFISIQAHLKDAQAIAHLGSWELDYSTGVAIWSDEQLRIYGLQPENKKQSFKTWTSFIYPEDVDDVIRVTNDTSSTLGNADFFYRIIRSDGTLRHLYSQIRTKVDNKGNPTGLHGVTLDVSDTKNRENALQQSQLNLKAIFENTSDGFILADINGIIKSFNNKARDRIQLNIEREIDVGKNIFDFLPGEKMDKDNISNVLSGEIVQYDYPFARKSGETKWFSFTINPVYNEENIEGISITSTDITERKKAEQQLHESELFSKGILASLRSHIAVIDNTGNIIAVNKAWDDFAKANGVISLQHVSVGSNYIEVCRRSMASGDILAGKALEGIQSVFNKEIKNFELEYPCHSLTEERWFNLSAMNFGDDDSKIVISHYNITARKLVEEKLMETSGALKKALSDVNRIMDSSVDIICSISEEGRFISISAACQRVWGYTPGELIGRKYMDFVFVEYSKITQKVNDEVRNGEPVTMFENKYVHKDGRVIPMLWSSRWDEKDQLFYSIAKDATEKKILEKAIENERDRFSEMFLQAPASIAILKGPEHIFQMANEFYLNLTDRKNIIGKTVRETFPEVESQGFLDVLDQVYRTGETFVANERLLKLKIPGTEELKEVCLNFVYQAYHNEQDEIVGIFVFVIDITEQHKAKERLLITSERLRLATTSAKMGIWDWDIENDVMTWDKRMYELYGIGPQQFTGTYSDWQKGIHRGDMERFAKELNEAIKEIYDFDTEFRVVWPDKSVRFIEAHAIVLKNEEGIVVRMIGINIDITERKKTEEKILMLNEQVAKSGNFFKGVIESSDDMITIIDSTGKTIYASPAVSKKFGYTNEECLNISITDIVHPDDAMILQEFVMKTVMHPSIPMVCPIIRDRKKDGTYMLVEGTLTNFLETEGINAVVAIFRDVTEKKKLEDLLDKSNRLAAIGSWEIDVIKGTVFWSDITKEIREADPDFIPDLGAGLQLFKEGSDRNTISKSVKDGIEKGIPWDDELQIVTQKGNLKWIRTIGQGEFIDGKCIKVYGSFQDIDTRKKTEIDVLKVYEEKNIILESIGDAFFAVDKNWVVTYWNNQAEKLFHIPKNKIIEQHLWKIFKEDIDSESYIKYHEAIETKRVNRFEHYFVSLDKWCGISSYPSDNGLSVFIKDITQQKKSADEREKVTADLIQRNKDLEQFSYIVSHNMRSPVANIIGLCDVLQTDNLTDDFKSEILGALSSSVNRLDDVFRDLNNILKVRREVNDIKEVVCFSKLIKNITLSIESIIEKEKALVLFDFSEVDEMLTIKSYLHSIFYNLISNSLKYKQHGISPVIKIRTQQLKNKVVVFFNDNGIGIDLEKRGDQVFGLYKRFHTDMAEGKGMGLYMVKTQVESIGGKIGITSEVNKGTEFKIEFDT